MKKNNIRIFNATFFIAIIIKLKKNSAETFIASQYYGFKNMMKLKMRGRCSLTYSHGFSLWDSVIYGGTLAIAGFMVPSLLGGCSQLEISTLHSSTFRSMYQTKIKCNALRAFIRSLLNYCLSIHSLMALVKKHVNKQNLFFFFFPILIFKYITT